MLLRTLLKVKFHTRIPKEINTKQAIEKEFLGGKNIFYHISLKQTFGIWSGGQWASQDQVFYMII